MLIRDSHVQHVRAAAIVAGARCHLDVFRTRIAGGASGGRCGIRIDLHCHTIEWNPDCFTGPIAGCRNDLERIQLAG
jgi:hypothetical protein